MQWRLLMPMHAHVPLPLLVCKHPVSFHVHIPQPCFGCTLQAAAVPKGVVSGPLSPTAPSVVPAMSSSASPLGDMFGLTGWPAARPPPHPELPLITEGMPSPGPAAEAGAPLPSSPTLSEIAAEVTGCLEEHCAVVAQKQSEHIAPHGHGRKGLTGRVSCTELASGESWHGTFTQSSDMLPVGAMLMPPSAFNLRLKTSSHIRRAMTACTQRLMLLQIMSGAMLGSDDA